jgi:hypothetical protein
LLEAEEIHVEEVVHPQSREAMDRLGDPAGASSADAALEGSVDPVLSPTGDVDPQVAWE